MFKHTKTNLLLLVARKVAISFRFVLVLALLASGILYTRAGTPERAYAATASTLNFQARLLQSSGAIVGDGTYNVEFKLYDASTGGTAIWTETRTGASKVTVKGGYLSVYLGDISALPSGGWDQERFLTLNIGGTDATPVWDGEMSPRLRLTAVPYAFQAQRAEGLEKLIGSFTGTLNFGALGQNTVYTLPDPGQASVSICLSSGNCAGQGGTVSGSGTMGRLSYFDTINGNNLADSWLLQDSGNSTLELDSSRNLSLLGGNLSVTGSGNFTGGLTIGDDATDTLTINGTAVAVPNGLNVDSNTFVIDALNNRVGIGDATPAAALTVGNGDLFQVNASGAIATATGITSSGTITFSTLGTGIVTSNASGVLSYGILDRNSTTYFSGTLSVPNGGTGATSFTSNGIVYGNGTGALLSTAAGADSVLITSATNVPSLSQTLPDAVQGNITSVGTLTSGSIASGFGTISTGNNITTTAALQGGSLSITGNGTIGGTLNVQGASVSVGTSTQQGSLVLNDGSLNTATILSAALGQNTAYTLPETGNASAEFCVRYGSGQSNCSGLGNAVDSLNGLLGNLIIAGTVNEIEVTDNGTDTITIGLPDDVTIASNLTVTDLATFNGGLTIANNGNFSQTGTGTFSTGTGAVSLNGATSVTGTNTFTVGTGLTTLGGGLTATGTTSINETGTATTVIGNTNALLTLNGSSIVLGTASVTRTATGTTTFDLIDGADTTLAVTNTGLGVANLTVDGSATFATGLTVSSGGASITGNSTITGTLTGLTGLTSSGSITFSGLSTGLLSADASGVISSGTVDRDSSSYFSGTLSVANGGTGANTFASNGILFGNGTGAIQATGTANDSILVTDATGNPSLSQTLPLAVQGNITQTGALDAGSITSGFGSIDVGADAISTTGTVSAGTLSVSGNAAIGGTLDVTGLATFSGGLIVTNGDQLTNAGSTLFTAIAIADLPTGGSIGTAAATVDGATTFNINQTTTGQTLTLPAPTDTTAGRIVYINNIGTANFTMGGVNISSGRAQGFIWTGSAWTGAGIDSAGDGANQIGAIDGQPKSANGAVITNNTLYLQTADATYPGLVSTGSQIFAGAKTFNGQIVADGGINLGTQTLQGTTAIIDFTNFDVDASGNTDVAGTFSSGTGNAFTIDANGAITAATGITSSGTITFSGLGIGLLTSNASGVISSGTVDRDSSSYFSGTLSVANGGTGANTFASNGILFGNGTGAIQATGTANDSILVTDATGNPSLSQTLPLAVQGNITSVGTLTSGSIASGFGTISTANNITTTAGLSGGTLTVTNDATIGGDVTVSGGQLSIGTAAGQAGSIILYDGGSAGTENTLTLNVVSSLGQNTVVSFPDPGTATAEVCYRNDSNCGFALATGANYVQFTPSSAQVDNNAFASIFINDTGGGHLLHLQSGGNDRFVVENDGDVTVSGDLAVNGGDITSTAGLNVTASNGALTFSSVGLGNDIVLNSADTIELQDSTNVTGNLDTSGTLAVGTLDAFTVNASGAITAATGIVSSGTIQFSGLSTGIVTADGTGVIASGTLDRNSSTYFTGTLSVASGGTGTTSFNTNGIVYYDGTTQVSTTAGADSVLITSGTNVPSLSQTLPLAVQGNITRTGALDAGSITSGFGAIDTGADNIQTTGTIQGGIVNATTGFQINGGAVTGNYLRGDGTNFISSQLLASDLSGTIFNSSADTGTGTFVTGDTIAIQGGTNGIDTSLTGDAYTINLDTTEIGTTTFGAGSGFTWTFDASALGTDTSFAFGDDALTVTAASTTLSGDLAVNGGDLTSTSSLNVTASNGALTLTSTGLGNDVVINSADTIELQDNTNIAGALSVSNGLTVSAGGASIAGNTTIATTAGNTLSIGNATGALTVTGSSASTFVINGVTITASEFNLLDGKDAALVDINDAVNTAITGTGALDAGSITSGFGAIDTGADNIQTTGTVQGGIVNATTGFQINGGAVTGNYLRGDGTNFVSSALLASDLSGTIFNTAADSGSGTLVTSDTISIQGGTNGIDTSLTGDTFTLNLDTTEIGTTTFGAGSGFTWTFDASVGTDTSFTFGDNALTLTAGVVTLSGDLRLNGNDIQDSAGTVRLSLGATNAFTGSLTVSNNLDVAGTLTAGTGDAFQVNASGAITAVTGITTTGGYTQSGSGANTFSGATGFTSTVNTAFTSPTAFRVQNTGGADTMFTVDTDVRGINGGNRIKIGDSTGLDGAVTILQVDSTTADITSNLSVLNGGLYYNSTTNTLKTILNGAVDEICTYSAGNCVGSGGSVSGVGTAGRLPIYSGTGSTITDSWLQQSGSDMLLDNTRNLVLSGGNISVTGNGDFSGTLAVGTADALTIAANGDTVTAGDLAVNGGDITSTGALNITPGGALTVGVASQTATLQGTITTIASNGAGNDIILSSADAIELQGATNVTGNFTVSGNADIAGTLFVGTGDAFQVDANGNILTSGDLAVNGGDITSTGALNITPGGALTVGAIGQTALMQGSAVSITSNGLGSDITLTSADQIILNSVGTIELQDNTNVTGNFTVSGNADVAGYLYIGNADQFQVDASGNTQTSGTLSVDGLSTLSGGLSLTRTLGADSGTTQNVGNIGFTTPADTIGTNISNGLNITPVIGDATGGTNTANIINIADTAGDAQVSLNAVNIGALTGTAANEYALNIGSGWDSILRVGGTEVINGSGQVVSSQITGDLFSTSADSGTGAVARGDTFAIQGGTNGIDTSLSGDTYTLDLDYTEISTATFGSGSGFTWTYDVGAVDPAIAFASDQITLTVGSTILSGDLAVNGGDITSTGALNITPGGALTVGVATQTTTIQGTATAITSNGIGNDVTVTSADQIILNSVGTIELQDNTNVTGDLGVSGSTAVGGNLSVTGNGDLTGTLAVGTADAFTVAANGDTVTAGNVAINGGAITSSAGTLTVNAGGVIDLQNAVTADSLTLDTGALTFSNGVATDITTALNENLTVEANGTGFIDLNDIVRIGTLGATDTDAVICRNAAGQLAACSSTFLTGSDLDVTFQQGGNSFTATAVLGTNDAFNLELETAGVTRLTIDQSGNSTLTGNQTVQGTGTSTFAGNVDVAGTLAVGTADAFQVAADGSILSTTSKTSGTGYAFDTTDVAVNGTSIDVQSSSSSQFAFQVTSGNGTINGISVRADGSVGVGTTGPQARLHIQGTADDEVLIVQGHSTQNANILEVKDSGGTVLAAVSGTGILRVGTTAAPTLGTAKLLVTEAEITTRLRIGDATNGISFNDEVGGQFRLRGTARNTKRVNLIPEFPGATMTGDGTNNIGTMTSDFCSGSTLRSINTTICNSTDEHNYYSWTAQATNDYDIYVRYQIPSDFDGFASDTTIQMFGWRSTSTENVELALFNAAGNQCGSGATGTSVATSNLAWTQVSLAGVTGDTDCTAITPGSTVLFRVRLTVGSNNNFARAGAITFEYLSKF